MTRLCYASLWTVGIRCCGDTKNTTQRNQSFCIGPGRFGRSFMEPPRTSEFGMLPHMSLPRIESQTDGIFSVPKNRTLLLSFLYRFPDGRDRIVTALVRAKPTWRSVSFDFYNTDWVLRSSTNPNGFKSTLEVVGTHEQFAIRIQEAIDSLPDLLMPFPIDDYVKGASEALMRSSLREPRKMRT